MTDEHEHAMKVWREAYGAYVATSIKAAAAVIAADRAGLVAEIERLRGQRDEAVQALADYRGKQYAPWADPDPEDTIGSMIDNQAWVMMSHIASYIGHRDGDPDMMDQWQDDWADNYPNLLKGWFSPHRALASYIAERLTIRAALKDTRHDADA